MTHVQRAKYRLGAQPTTAAAQPAAPLHTVVCRTAALSPCACHRGTDRAAALVALDCAAAAAGRAAAVPVVGRAAALGRATKPQIAVAHIGRATVVFECAATA